MCVITAFGVIVKRKKYICGKERESCRPILNGCRRRGEPVHFAGVPQIASGVYSNVLELRQ